MLAQIHMLRCRLALDDLSSPSSSPMHVLCGVQVNFYLLKQRFLEVAGQQVLPTLAYAATYVLKCARVSLRFFCSCMILCAVWQWCRGGREGRGVIAQGPGGQVQPGGVPLPVLLPHAAQPEE